MCDENKQSQTKLNDGGRVPYPDETTSTVGGVGVKISPLDPQQELLRRFDCLEGILLKRLTEVRELKDGIRYSLGLDAHLMQKLLNLNLSNISLF